MVSANCVAGLIHPTQRDGHAWLPPGVLYLPLIEGGYGLIEVLAKVTLHEASSRGHYSLDMVWFGDA